MSSFTSESAKVEAVSRYRRDQREAREDPHFPLPFENPDGSPWIVDIDYFGRKRDPAATPSWPKSSRR